ncbi:MAG: ABC transporter transmembrane domain-containing protein, partial [Bacteroidota bacterium]
MKGPIAAFIAIEILMVFVGLSFAMCSQLFIDEILTPPTASWVGLFLLGYAALVVSNTVISWLQDYLLNRTGVKISIALSTLFFQHIMRLPLAFFHQRHLSEILRRMSMNIEVAEFVTERLASAVLGGILIVVYLFVINQYDSTVALIILLVIAYNAIMLIFQNRFRKNIYAKSEQITAQYSGLSIDAVSNIETMRLAGTESFMFQRIIGTNNALINTEQAIKKRDALIQSFSLVSDMLISILFISLIGWKVVYGSLTAGMYVTIQILIGFITAPISQLIGVGLRMPMLKMDLMRIDDVMNTKIDPMVELKEKSEEEKAVVDLKGEIVVENIFFGYQPLTEPIIRDISFKIESGEFVGINGPNGSGKSTIMRLVAGQYYPRSGKILFDGINIFELPLTITKRAVAISEREALFVKGTVRENLTFWNPYIKEEEIIGIEEFGSETIYRESKVEPRLSIRYKLDPQSSLKFSYTRSSQFINQISNTETPLPTDIWQLTSPYIPPHLSHNFSLGYFRNFDQNKWITSLNLFYRDIDQLFDYKDFANLVSNDHIETEL